jgi:hydroxypyruvate reductase
MSTSSNSKHHIITAPYLPPYLQKRLEEQYICHVWDNTLTDAKLAEIAPSIKAIASKGETVVSREFINRLPALEIIAGFGVGYDGVDVAAARERNIPVTNTPDVLTDDVADLAIALMLATARQVASADKFVRDGKWPNGPYPLTTKVSGAKLGIVGLGRIGKAIARRAAGFDMDISYHNRSKQADVSYPYFDSLVALATEVDFLIVSTPGSASTKALINADVLKALGPKGFLINVARGSVADQPALVAALLNGTIAGAGLDVFADEPNAPAELFNLPNVVLTPHMASGTVSTRTAMADLAFGNLSAHFAGQPLLTPVP